MKNPLKKFGTFFSENKFWTKVKSYSRQAGLTTVYSAMLLFYAFKKPETPLWARNIILGTLGYFIAPIDAIPDLTPILGYTDDVGILGFGLVTIACYVDDQVKINARKKLRQWFGDFDLQELAEVDKKL